MTKNEEIEKPHDMKHCDKIFTSTNNTFTAIIGLGIRCHWHKHLNIYIPDVYQIFIIQY